MSCIYRCFCWWLASVGPLIAASQLSAQTNQGSATWEKEIAAFETSDRTNPPPHGGILFIGSSSFRKWTNVTEYFPGKPIINRGFGGSQIADSTAFADRIVFPYQPRLIIFYAGDNDIGLGHAPEKVAADFQAFIKKVHARLPDTTIDFVSIKPSPLRWKLHEKMIAANEKIKSLPDDHFKFIDVYPLMLDADGKPKAEYFISDGLHPSEACYRMWARVIRPYLD